MSASFSIFLKDIGEKRVSELLSDNEEGEVEKSGAKCDPFEVPVVRRDPDSPGLGRIPEIVLTIEFDAAILRKIFFRDAPGPKLVADCAGEALVAKFGEAASFFIVEIVSESCMQVFEGGGSPTFVEMVCHEAEAFGAEQDEGPWDEGDGV